MKFQKSGSISEILADKGQLKIALTNVIDNCIRYTDKGGVAVKIKENNNKVLITIKDTGIGMSKDMVQSLFNQAFNRGQEAQKISAVGKGIGLYLSSKIIESHKGKIWAESEGQGKGSTFYIELPIV